MVARKGLKIALGLCFLVPAHRAWSNPPEGREPLGLEEWQPVSYLPLAGSLQDEVTGGALAFSRSSVAFSRAGDLVAPNVIRTESFALETARSFESITPDVPGLRPMAADGCLFYGATDGDVYASSDGRHWLWLDELPSFVFSIFVTDAHAVLAAAGVNGNCGLYRRAPAGGPFVPVLDLDLGKPMPWNWIETDGHILFSEYGPKRPPNARRIFRSADDGVTWELVYDPEYRFTHNHRLLWDPYGARITQMTGDGLGNHLSISSEDDGDTWSLDRVHFPTLPSLRFGGPTGGLARPEGVYWGLDGRGPVGVYRSARGTGRWETVLSVGVDHPQREDQLDGNVFDMMEHDGIVYVPIVQTAVSGSHHAPALYTSLDGNQWSLAARFGADEGGISEFLGVCDNRLWANYTPSVDTTTGTRLLAIDAIADHRVLVGSRLEGPVVNLWDSPETSSAEGTIDLWRPLGGASLEADTSQTWHGSQSVHVTCDDEDWAGVGLPTFVGDLAAGTIVSVLVHVYGKPRDLRLDVYDDASTKVGSSVFDQMSERWSAGSCTVQLPAATSSLSVRLRQAERTPALEFWVDGIMLSVGPGGDTWQVGGTARDADHVVYDFEFPPVWTDLFLWVPDPGADGPHATRRTLKVYEAGGGGTLSVTYDPLDNVLRLEDSTNPANTVVTPPFLLGRYAVLRVGVVQAASSRTLYVRIAEGPYVGTKEATPLDIVRVHLGSDADGGNACGGVHARHRLFDQAADLEQLEQLVVELIRH